MPLTKISTDGVKDDAITKAKIPADQIEASELANNAVDTNAIQDEAVTLAKLPHGDTNNDGKFLRANNNADPSFETVDLANLNAGNLTSGTIPDARFPAALPAVSGANLTNLPPGAVTNLIQNGNMAVHQRWSGSADTTNGWGSADRFRLEYVNTVNTVSQNIVRLSSSSGNADDPFDDGLRNIFQITNGNQTSTATNAMVQMAYGALARDLLHSGWDHTSSSSYLTLSYYVRSSVAGTFYGRVYTPLGGGKHFAWSTGALTANTWKRVTVQIPGDSSFNIPGNDLSAFLFYFNCYAGTSTTDSSSPTSAWGAVSGSNQYPDYANDNWYSTNGATMDFTGVQLEAGQTANPFAHEPYETTLRKCQQYYFVACSDNYELLGIGHQYYSGYIYLSVPFPVEMIAEPTLIALSGSSGAYMYEKLHNSSAAYIHQISIETNKTSHSRACIEIYGDASKAGQSVRVAAHWSASNAHKFVAFQAELS
tara:strand:+ start:1388 stop:2830 length:1443 start_codon:yes stop_codon:yes gene_type:complete